MTSENALYDRGISVWHASSQLINSLSLFRGAGRKSWLPAANMPPACWLTLMAGMPRMHSDYTDRKGMGLGKIELSVRSRTYNT